MEVNGFARTTIKDSAQISRYVQFQLFNAEFDEGKNIFNLEPEVCFSGKELP